MAGWDKAPEYGGSGHWLTNLLTALVLIGLVALALWPREASADPCTAPLPTQAGAEFGGVVRHVIDGDSICIGPAGGDGSTRIEVRLVDFDAPELRQPGGVAARDTLRRLAWGREARCVVIRGRTGTRSYDRTHAICGINGRTLGDLMREAGAIEGGH